jgi:hypothetical protein
MLKVLGRLNYANVMATIAVFLAIGGGAYAAGKLGKNAVKTKNIAAGAVKTNKLGNNAVTTAKLANGAVTQAKVKPIAFTTVTAFTNSWTAAGGNPAPQFGKDALGIVHLQGQMADGNDNQPAFTLPAGFRPPGNRSWATTSGFATECTIGVEANGEVTSTGCNNLVVSLDPISFVAQ